MSVPARNVGVRGPAADRHASRHTPAATAGAQDDGETPAEMLLRNYPYS